MSLVDCRGLSEHTRHTAAERLRLASDFNLPDLIHFNNAPCPAHSSVSDGATQIPPCRACGINFRRHQRVGIAWLYLRGCGLIADQMGLGKTAQAAGLIAAIKEIGELDGGVRVLVVCRAPAIDQWIAELRRFLPGMDITSATGTKAHRIEKYLSRWDVLVTGYQMLVNDLDALTKFSTGLLVVDDVDPLRNPSNQTAYAIKQLARRTPRRVVLTGTPLQKRLHELHSILELVGGLEVFGSATKFRRQYVREELIKVYNHRVGRMVSTRKVVGYKNLDDFVAKVRPMTLRRTPADLDDVDLPVITPHHVYLDLYPAQRTRYTELQRGVVRIIKAEGEGVKHAQAVAKFLYGAQICAGLSTLGEPDGPGTSVKLDWVQRTIVDGDLSEEKVIVFCQFTNTVQSLAARLDVAGVGHVVIWGREQDRRIRAAATARFWDDPTCRVLIGTSAIEQSLNLQVSRHLINVDQLMNPARMQQLAGRIRRDGSPYRTVYVHNLLSRGTQEDGYLDVLGREQALADHVWGESNQLYEALNPLAMLHLIGGSGGTR